MALTFKHASCCLFYLVFSVVGYKHVTASFKIERGKYDTFKNLLCNQTTKSCTREQCQSYRAECADDQCVRCRCSEDGRNTFVTGKCAKDDDVMPESGMNTESPNLGWVKVKWNEAK